MSPTIRRVFVLLSCTFLGLICGTLYLYSSYSPQLARRLDYSVTDLSSIALFGTLGVAVSGPLAGVVVDRRGYTTAMVLGGMAIIGGYLGLKHQYDSQYSSLVVSCFLLFAVGSGLTYINSACLKCCAVSFPSIRGVATSLPLALYGLSALFYSVIASMFYPGQTSAFLGVLAYSALAIFAVCSPLVMLCDREHTRRPHARTRSGVELLVLSPAPSKTEKQPDTAIWTLPKFWMLFVVTGMLASLGQMYIYSVGYMVKALVTYQVGIEGEIDALVQRDQQFQVGLLSMANCIGRIASGIAGDIITQSFNRKRSWLLFLPSFGLLLTQLMARLVSVYASLGLASLLTGFFYGFTFCIMPIIVGDVFGMDNFSFNWGIVGLAPIVPSFYFTNLFGLIFDSHLENGSCLLGRACYSEIFSITTVVAIVAAAVVVALNFERTQPKPQVP